jgi:hypothetical protein
VSTTFTEGASPGWAPLLPAKKIAGILAGVLDESSAPSVVTVPAEEVTAAVFPPAATEEPRTSWFSLTGWRWAVPGALLGLVVGAVAARRPRDTEPRQVLISSEA